MVDTGYKFLRFAEYKDFGIWAVKNYLATKIYSKYTVDSIGKYIKNQTKKVKLFDMPNEVFGILGISNDVGMFDAYEELGININQPYKIVENNFIAYNPYRINVGSIGIKTEILKNKYISPAYVVFSCKETLSPNFLYILMRGVKFNALIKSNTTGSVRQTLGFDVLSKIRIPIPPLPKQYELIKNYEHSIVIATEYEKKANDLNDTIDSILFDELGIENIPDVSNLSTKVSLFELVDYKDLIQWNVKKSTLKIKPKEMFKSKIYSNVMLAQYAEINPSTDFSALSPDSVLTFLPMECISDTYGDIEKQYEGEVSKSKGYTRFRNGDVLFAKITPCMQNGKCVVARNLTNGYGYGSTEYHVIRPKSEKILGVYIQSFLRTKIARTLAQEFFTGSAGQQRVGDDYLENLFIPLPPVEVQEDIIDRIKGIKNEIKTLRTQAKSLRAKAKREFEEEVFGE